MVAQKLSSLSLPLHSPFTPLSLPASRACGRFDGHLQQVVVGAVVDVEVYVAVDARQAAGVGVLPELPGASVLQAVHVVVGNPVGELVEKRVVEILQLELVVGVDDGLHAVVALHHEQPGEHVAAEVVAALLLGLLLHVEHGRQVAPLQLHLADERLRLVDGWRLGTVEVVGATGEAVLAGSVEVVLKVFVHLVGTLRGLNHDEAYGAGVDDAIAAQPFPVYVALVVADVDAVYVVAPGVAHLAQPLAQIAAAVLIEVDAADRGQQ